MSQDKAVELLQHMGIPSDSVSWQAVLVGISKRH
jgi:hypothetical protein